MLAISVNELLQNDQKDMTTIVKSRNLADKCSHRFITGLEGAKVNNNTTKMNMVTIVNHDNHKLTMVLHYLFHRGICSKTLGIQLVISLSKNNKKQLMVTFTIGLIILWLLILI